MGELRSGADVEHSQGVPGTAMTRDGRALFYMRRPGSADAPTVVFEGGLAASRSYWAPAQVAVADRAPTVVYDRSGLGRSAPGGRPRTLPRLAADLGDLLAPLPADARADMRAEGFTVGTIRTRAAGLASVVTDMTALRDNPLDPLDVPVTVISAGRTSTGMNARIRTAVDASHKHRAEQHRLGRHIYAPNSGHLVPAGDPDLIAAEIHRMLP